jgi:hypothetical protein
MSSLARARRLHLGVVLSAGQQHANPTHRWLLRARRKRPTNRRTADKRDEIAPLQLPSPG